jgi:mannan endo-1,4-beta-mannosidase
MNPTPTSFLSSVLLALIGFAPLTTHAQSLNNPNATSSTRAVYEYIKNISAAGATGQIILGQHSGHGSSIVLDSVNAAATHDSQVFNLAVQPIFNQTGKWPGILSLDYEFDYARTMEGAQGPTVLTDKSGLVAGNNKLKEWWSQGGLVTVNWTPANPWGTAPTSGVSAGYPNQYASTQEVNGSYYQPGSLNDLLTVGTVQNTAWRRQLDTVATALSDLQNAGVTVLWRPMQEMVLPVL